MTLSSVWLALAMVPIAQQSASGTTRVAVVSVAVVSEKYARTSDLEARFEERRVRLRQERDTRQQKVELTARSLQEELKPGTEAYEERRKELAMLEADLQWFVESENRRLEQNVANSLRSIFADIQEAVRAVAEEKGIDIVLACDELTRQQPENSTQVRQEILLQKVVYWKPSVDLTTDVIRYLNAKYRGQGSAAPTDSGGPTPSGGASTEPAEQAEPISTQGP
jgi:Skp family chaperone for outer membrane proteins